MQYDAITLDTNVFHRNGYNLEGGLLRQLAQFKEGSARLVLSEIVFYELRRHLIKNMTEERNRLLKVTRNATHTGLLPKEAAEEITRLTESALLPEVAAEKRLDAFVNATGLEIIPFGNTNLDAVVRRYFSTDPPFEPTGSKTKEFPDAIALMSLEAWARKHEFKLLAISQDTGWFAYANDSTYLDVQDDLAKALATFQAHQAQAQALVSALLQRAIAGQAEQFVDQVREKLAEVILLTELVAKARSSEEFETGPVKLELRDFKLTGHKGDASFNIVRTGANKIHFTVLSTITVNATCTFSFLGWDDDSGLGHVYGEEEIAHEDWFESDLLIELHAEELAQEVDNVELLDDPESIDFGQIESLAAWEARRS